MAEEIYKKHLPPKQKLRLQRRKRKLEAIGNLGYKIRGYYSRSIICHLITTFMKWFYK